MGAVTYPDPSVVAELSEHFVCCRLESAEARDLSRRMGVRWLPGLVVADWSERPAHVEIGFLPPRDFIRELTFGRAILAMDRRRYDEANLLFATVTAERDAERAPEALYWWGISRKRETKDFAACQEKWAEIARRWPGSQWERRVSYALPQGPGSG